MAEEGDQPTEEQVTAAITGAQTLFLPEDTSGTPSGLAHAALSSAVAPNASSSLMPPGRSIKAESSSSPRAANKEPSVTSNPSIAPSQIGSDPQLSDNVALSVSIASIQDSRNKATSADPEPTKEDAETDMQVESELREHDVRMAPELVGPEAASTRAALGL